MLAKAAAASLDDIAAGANKAASQTVAVVIDDAAVTPQFVQGISPSHELRVVRSIAIRSLINKAILLAAIMLLSMVLPWIFDWILIVGGSYLAYEGVEKIIHQILQHRSRQESNGHAAHKPNPV